MAFLNDFGFIRRDLDCLKTLKVGRIEQSVNIEILIKSKIKKAIDTSGTRRVEYRGSRADIRPDRADGPDSCQIDFRGREE